LNFRWHFLTFSFQLLIIVCLCGCTVVDFVTSEDLLFDEQNSAVYKYTKLKVSNAADVLTVLSAGPGFDYELLSHSSSVIASAGQKKKGYKTWFNMVAFDENELTAKRKYLFIVDEKPKFLFVQPRPAFSFDCRIELPSRVLQQPYANDNAWRTAILKQVLVDFKNDVDQVYSNNNVLSVSGMLVNQAIEAVLVELSSSPVLAGKLSDFDGLKFEHLNFDKGRIRMLLSGNIVTVEIRSGSAL
jgi:hypothetical protein